MSRATFIPSSFFISAHPRTATSLSVLSSSSRSQLQCAKRSNIICKNLYPDPLPPQQNDPDDESEEYFAATSKSYLERLNRATENRRNNLSASQEQANSFLGTQASTPPSELTGSDQNPLSVRMSATSGTSAGSQSYKPASRAFWRIGWLTWWIQLILTVISAVIIVFALAFPAVDIRTSASSVGFVLTTVAIIIAFVSLICTFGYTRLSVWLNSSSASELQSKASYKISNRLRVGISVALLGLAIATLGLQAIVGTLLARVLSAGISANSFKQSNPASNAISSSLVQPIDVLVVQASANVILALLVVVSSSLWFRRQAKSWGQNF